MTNELDQIEANTNNNYMPDNAFTSEPSTIPDDGFNTAEAFQVEDKPTSAFDKSYEQMTQLEKFQAHKEAVYKKHQVDTTPRGPTVADNLAAQSSAKFTVHQDGSVTSKGGILGNERDSMSMIQVLREQAYQRHNITE